MLEDSKKQQHYLEVSLRTRHRSYTKPSRAKSLLNTSLKFSLDENRIEETLVSRLAPWQNLPCYPDLNETPTPDTVDYVKREWQSTKLSLIWSTTGFMISHTSLLYISSKITNILPPSKETSEKMKVLYRTKVGGGECYHRSQLWASPTTKTLICKPSTGRSLKLTFTIVCLSEKYWELESPETQKLFSLCSLR